MAQEETRKLSAAPSVVMAGRIEIFPSQPLPEYSSPAGVAYAARFRNDAASSLFAIVCLSKMPPRVDTVQSVRVVDNPGVLKLVDAGVVQWNEAIAAYALVYQRPTAPTMLASLEETKATLSEDAIARTFIAPMISALTALNNAGVVHNALRPGNIFWRVGSTVPPQIGDCLSVPAGVGQPLLFEPIERAQASPLGRGVGTHADDCYAFGMTLAFVMVGGNPLQGMDDRAVLDIKMQRGSFAAVVGSHRLLPAQIEILRGLLSDNPLQRWTASDLDQWLGGRRMTLKSAEAGTKAGRHFVFMEKQYWHAHTLAEALAAYPEEAAKAIENESINKWLRRALNDTERAREIEAIVEDLKQDGKTAHYEDQLVARVCIALDPRAPIRYRGISAMPAGVPALLAEAGPGGNPQELAEIIMSQLIPIWLQLQLGENRTPLIALGQLFDRARSVLEKTTFGNGIERAIYEMNPGIPCLSPLLKGQYVSTAKALLPALERIATGGSLGRDPIDRHIAAFLIVREKRSEKTFLPFSGTENSTARGLALLSVFADLQYKYGPDSLPHLAAWLSSVVDPAIKRYNSKNVRDVLQKKAKDYIAAGKLPELLRLVDDGRRLEKDEQEFSAARLLYLSTLKEIVGLEAKANNQGDIATTAGKPIAVTISSMLAIILICAAIVRAMFGALF